MASIKTAVQPKVRARCAWGEGCREPAGHGRFGNFCETHAEALAAVELTAADLRAPKAADPVARCALTGCGNRAWGNLEPARCYFHRTVPPEVTIAPPSRRAAKR